MDHAKLLKQINELKKELLSTTYEPLGKGSKIQMIDFMGGDLAVVNDARASFENESLEFNEKDAKLLKYLIKHEHWSPFRGSAFKFKVAAPLYICRQWFKHIVASTHIEEQFQWNEKSMRYVEAVDPEQYYVPDVFRLQSSNNKQATCGELDQQANEEARLSYEVACKMSYEVYRDLIDTGVGREQARGVLDPAFYTSWTWTASLQALLNFIYLRQGKGAQSEISLYATAILRLLEPFVPKTVEYWNEINE